MDNLKEKFMELLAAYPGMVIGGGVGLLAALFVLTFGIFNTLILVVCVGGGLVIGKMLMEK
ncbi:MAG: DUF2273 domain-containing protein [bacterium]